MKKLSEMNLVDNFLFGAAMDHEEAGRLIGKTILETILHREIQIRSVNPEKTIWSSDTEFHGIRLDAYIEEEGTAGIYPGNVYDVEPDQKSGEKRKLPKRARFYHSHIDMRLLQSGESYDLLPSAMVIFITTFDPFGQDRMIYTIRKRCIELPEMEYDDGAVTIFLYVKGKEGNPPKDLQELLKYLSETKPENACNPELCRIQDIIENIRRDPQVRRHYMNLQEYLDREVEEEVEKRVSEELEKRVSEKLDKRMSEELDKRMSEELDKRVSEELDKAVDTAVAEEKNRADLAEERAALAEAEILRLRALLKNAGISD